MFGYNNVYYDKNSVYCVDSIHEYDFLREIFNNLRSDFNLFENFDFYIYTQHNTNILPESCYNSGSKILIYLSNETNSQLPSEVINNYKFIFKSHLDKSLFKDINNLYYLPLGYSKFVPKLPIKNITERKYNLFFSGNLNINRINVYNETLKNKAFYENINSYIKFTDGFAKGLSPEEYANVLNESKIVLSPRGFITTDCFRTYEAMRQGCIVISDKLFDEEIFNNSPIIQIKDWSDLSYIANYIISNEDFINRLSNNTIQYYENIFSGKGVSKYIVDIINSRYVE